MDQTTLSQYFQTRKNSFSTALPPAKRVRLDSVTKMDKKEQIKRATTPTVVKSATKVKTSTQTTKTNPTKSGRGRGRPKVNPPTEDKIFNLFNALPIESKSKPVGSITVTKQGKISGKIASQEANSMNTFTAVKESGGNKVSPNLNHKEKDTNNILTVVEPTTPKRKEVSVPRTPRKTPLKESLPKCNQLPLHEEINDQAKTILYSRGSAILKAGLEAQNLIKSPSKASEVLNLLSPRKKFESATLDIIGSPTKTTNFKSPAKLSGVLGLLSPRKLALSDSNEKSPVQRTNENIETKSLKEANSVEVIPMPQARRGERLRNKFRHLTQEVNQMATNPPTSSALAAPSVPPTLSKSEEKIASDGGEVTSTRREKASHKYKHLIELKPGETPGKSVVSKPKGLNDASEQQPLVKERASEKFKHLAKASVSGFVLPQKFKTLLEMFRCVDSVLFLLNQRSEVCTFEKLKRAVQEMCSRNFEEHHLAAMKTILPNAFVFRQEKGLLSTNTNNKSSHQLTIEASFKESLASGNSKVTSHVLITRRLLFETNLVDIVKQHHRLFLRKLNITIKDSEIHRWHPNFNLNSIPDIELSALPQPPMMKSFSNAAELIANNRGVFSAKVEKALENISNNTKDSSKEDEKNKNKDVTDVKSNSTEQNVNKNNTNSKLKGVSTSLVERIRQKEQLKMQLAMTRDPVKEEKLNKMHRLPEICRILKAYFTAEKKVTITLEDCVQKLSESFGTSIARNKLEDHVTLLADLVPEWITIPKIRKFPFVKLAKGYDINKVINKLNDIHTKESES